MIAILLASILAGIIVLSIVAVLMLRNQRSAKNDEESSEIVGELSPDYADSRFAGPRTQGIKNLEYVRVARRAGAVSPAQIAEYLNSLGIRTPRGKPWGRGSVANLIETHELGVYRDKAAERDRRDSATVVQIFNAPAPAAASVETISEPARQPIPAANPKSNAKTKAKAKAKVHSEPANASAVPIPSAILRPNEHAKISKSLRDVMAAKRNGCRNYAQVSDYLNGRGVRTVRGKEWTPQNVRNIVTKYGTPF